MTQKIIYFTKSAVVSAEEQADIEAINAICVQPYALNVANGSVPDGLGMTSDGEGGAVPILAECAYVAGTIPTAYQDIPVFDPDNPPAPPLDEDQAIVSDGGTVEVVAGGVTVNGTAAVSDSTVDSVALPATTGIVIDGQTIAVTGGTVTISVSANAVTAEFTPE